MTPTPAQSDGTLREQIEEAAMYGFREGAYEVHGIPVQSIVKLEALFAAEKARIFEAVEGDITERSKPDDNCSKWAEGVYQGHCEAVAELRAEIKRLREGSDV